MARSTEVSRLILAPRKAVYAACLDPLAVAQWRVPQTMTARIEAFDARPGGVYRMSLTYDDPAQGPGGKTTVDTDTFEGRFVELVPDEKIVEVVAFRTDDRAFAGEMTVTTRLDDADGGCRITMRMDGLPAGVRLEDNEAGTRQALDKLAALLA